MQPNTRCNVLRLSPGDNVGVVIRAVSPGELLIFDGGTATAIDSIPYGHKVAICPIKCGEKVLKYAAPIGSAVRDISVGEHVHVHNIKSDYLPTYLREGEARYHERA